MINWLFWMKVRLLGKRFHLTEENITIIGYYYKGYIYLTGEKK